MAISCSQKSKVKMVLMLKNQFKKEIPPKKRVWYSILSKDLKNKDYTIANLMYKRFLKTNLATKTNVVIFYNQFKKTEIDRKYL